jgi:hypothetical protein
MNIELYSSIIKNKMKSTIDQISFNAENLIYTMFLSIAGNQHQITITNSEADSLIKEVSRNSKVTIECHNNVTYWILY